MTATIQDTAQRIFDEFEMSRRHREICEQIIVGANNQQIADTLFLELSTVKNHITVINRTLGTSNRNQIVAVLVGAIPPPKPSPMGELRRRIELLERCAYKLDELIHSGSCRIAPHHSDEALALLRDAGIPADIA